MEGLSTRALQPALLETTTGPSEEPPVNCPLIGQLSEGPSRAEYRQTLVFDMHTFNMSWTS